MINIALKLFFVLGCAKACITINISKKTTPTPRPTAVVPRMMKRSVSEEDCAELQSLEDAAFKFCPHEEEGFTWKEVKSCEDYVKKISLINSLINNILPFEMPTKEDFDLMDPNKDGIMTMGEWRETVDCD